MFPIIKSVVDFGIPFVTTDNVSSCDPFNMQKLAIFKNRRKRPNLGDSSTSLNKRRNTSKADLLPSAQSNAPSSASTPALLTNPTAIQSTATVIHTPAANASTRSVAAGLSTPPSPKLNFFQKFTRKASSTFKKNKPLAARAGNNGSSSSSSSSSGGDDAMTADTSVEPTPTRGSTLRSSTIPEVAITPTSDSIRSASPAASIRTVFRVNPYTGRPAQQYDIDFLSPRTAAAAAKARRNRARSPRPIPISCRGGGSDSSASTPASSFPMTRTPTVIASSSLPAGFPTRSSSLRHSNEFPFSASAADLRADDSDLYHNGSGPSTPVSAHKFTASSPAVPGSAGSSPSLNKPLPGLPQEDEAAPAALPLSPAPSAGDDVFYDASPVSTASSATIAGSPKTPEQAVVSAAAASRISLTGFPTPPTTGHQAFMHRLPPTPSSQPVPSNSPAFGFSSPVLPEVGGDSYTIPPTPTPARATLATIVPRESPTYRLFPHQVDNRVLEARLSQIRATVDGVDNAEGEEDEKDESAEADAVMDDSFALDAGDMEPLISSSPLQCNRESFTSVLTQTTGVSFVTAAEDVEMEDVEVEDEGEMNDSSLVDVDGSTLVAEGAAEMSSDHRQMLVPSSPGSSPDVENDDSFVHVGDSTLDGTTLVAEVEPEPSLIANMNVDEEEAAEPEPATFQIVAKDGADTGVAVEIHAADTASSHDGSESSEDSKFSNPVNGHFPPQPFDGPPFDLIEEQQGRIKWRPGGTPVPDCLWVDDPDLAAIKHVVAAHIHHIGLDKDDFEVEYLAEGCFNKVYTIRKASVPAGTGPEYIFRVCLPAYPWYKVESEISTMELVGMYTSIPVPRVYVYDSDADNPVNHEWMIMDKMKGISFGKAQENMSMEQKTKLAETLADWMHQLSTLRFDKIGSIYRRRKKPATSMDDFKVGPIVDMNFMADWRLEYRIHRGPYNSIEQYFGALVDVNFADVIDPRQKARSEFCAAVIELKWLTTNLEECTDKEEQKLVEKALQEWASQPAEAKQARIDQLRKNIDQYRALNDEDDRIVHSIPRYPLIVARGRRRPDLFARLTAQCQALRFTLPHLCPSEGLRPSSTVLHHWDISEENVLVDPATGAAVALIDWEQVHALPFSIIQPYPSALDDKYDRPEPPEPIEPDAPEHIREMYEDLLEQHQRSLLRKAFRERLEALRSPHLEAFEQKDEELKDLYGLVRVADQMYVNNRITELAETVDDKIGLGF